MPHQAYVPRRTSRSKFMDMRGLQCHLRIWGPEDAPPVVLLHGSRDCSATFQFMIDEMRGEYRFIAPDLRGYGKTQWNPQGYWFADYLADLDSLLASLFGEQAVALVGHSLGGQVASIFASLRPQRVTKLVTLDAFGLVDEAPETTPDHLRKWLDDWRDGPEASRPYPALEPMADRLRQANGRLTHDKALFLAAESSRVRPDGLLEWSFDPRHRSSFATLHRKAEWAACMQRVEAPTLWLASGRVSRIDKVEPGGVAARARLLKNVTLEKVPDTSHNLHHDKPAEVARIVEAFLSAP